MAKILVVDDSAIPRMVLRKILETSGHGVLEAADGDTALTTYRRERPDLVVLDLVLKNASGLDVLGQLRGIDPGVRVILATGEADLGTRQRAFDSGAQGFLGKPFTAEQVLAAIEAVVAPATGAVLHLARLHDSCVGDAKTERACLGKLMASAPELLEQIATGLGAGDGPRVRIDAHTLKGSCLILGADALGGVCARLEEAAQEGNLDAARALLADAEHELERLREVVAAHLGDGRVTAP